MGGIGLRVARGALADLVALHGPGRLDGAAVEEEFLRERGLARIRVADDGEGAPLLDLGLKAHPVKGKGRQK